MNSPAIATPSTDDQRYSKAAFALMEKHGLPPTPENYAVWFHYAAGKNRELIAEIDAVIGNRLQFNAKTAAYLYGKYVGMPHNQKVIDDTALSAQKVLAQVLKAVKDFDGQTQSYNHDVDHYLENINQELADDEHVKNVFKELVTATVSLRSSGDEMHQKLEQSTQQIELLKHDLEEVTKESQRDYLTGLYNRKAFEELFEKYAAAAKEQKNDLCLLMVDIDHFKFFNDKFGHLLGDEVLKIVAYTLDHTLKGRDIVARFGGEEFVVILPETPLDGAIRVAESVRAAIASKELRRKDTKETYGTITVSIGVARLRPADNLKEIIKRADDALYASKQGGRNRVTKEA